MNKNTEREYGISKEENDRIDAEELAFEIYLEDAHVEPATFTFNPWE
jgi:hypothetical protein